MKSVRNYGYHLKKMQNYGPYFGKLLRNICSLLKNALCLVELCDGGRKGQCISGLKQAHLHNTMYNHSKETSFQYAAESFLSGF